MNIELFALLPDETILSALEKIDQNRKGFLVVVDPDGVAVGTITDGDIRRAFIRGLDIRSPIHDCYNRSFTRLSIQDDIGTSVEIFQEWQNQVSAHRG